MTTESMTKRIAYILLPALHHGMSPPNASPEEWALTMTRRILTAMRDPTDHMIVAGAEVSPDTAGNQSPAAQFYSAMIDAALAESVD
ncbi:hypothetical protein [Sphingomonas oryzagri]